MGLSDIHTFPVDKLKPKHNETTHSLQYCKLVRNADKSTEEWMGRLRVKEIKYKCKEIDRRLKEQFINGINDQTMTSEIRRELMVIKVMSDVTNEQILSWAWGIEAQGPQKAMPESLKGTKDFNMI